MLTSTRMHSCVFSLSNRLVLFRFAEWKLALDRSFRAALLGGGGGGGRSRSFPSACVASFGVLHTSGVKLTGGCAFKLGAPPAACGRKTGRGRGAAAALLLRSGGGDPRFLHA
jgi:hypothetical protein